MSFGQVRALCAQIALETNHAKCEMLIKELTTALTAKPAKEQEDMGAVTKVFSLQEHRQRKQA